MEKGHERREPHLAKALLPSAPVLLDVLHTLPDAAYIADDNFRIVYTNPAMEACFGPLEGRFCHSYLHGLDAPCSWCDNPQVFAGCQGRSEQHFPTIDKYFEVIETRIPGANGQWLKLALLRDITARRRAEAALKDTEVFNRTVLSSMGDGLIVLDSELRYRLWNQRIEEMTGLPAGNVVGRKAIEVFPDLRERGVLQRMEAALAGQTVHMPDLLYEAKGTGKATWYTGVYTPLRKSTGEITGVVIALSDIGRRKRAEEALALKERISRLFLEFHDDEVWQRMPGLVIEATRSRHGALGYIDADGALVCPGTAGSPWIASATEGARTVLPRDRWTGLWGRALLERRAVISGEEAPPSTSPTPFTHAICVPITLGGDLLGLIVAADRETAYGPEDLATVQAISDQVAAILSARIQRDQQAMARVRAEEALLTLRRQMSSERAFMGIVGRTPAMLDLFVTIREVAMSDLPVAIRGESGTGKELVAAAIHAAGPRANRPFVPVNCAALPEGLLESELFGHVRGAFTGAIRDKKGRFELADGGTLFLDEVGDLPPSAQVSLLRVLQEQVVERVGDEKPRRIDVRVISASHRDLRRLVSAGKFREDLFYRLCVIPIPVPPLRERRDDIPLLADHVLEQVRRETDGIPHTISHSAMQALLAHDWPGNVRELQNAIHYARVKCRGTAIEVRHLPASVTEGRAAATAPPTPPTPRGRRPKLTAEAVRRVMAQVDGNKALAALRLGVSRTTLYRYLESDPER